MRPHLGLSLRNSVQKIITVTTFKNILSEKKWREHSTANRHLALSVCTALGHKYIYACYGYLTLGQQGSAQPVRVIAEQQTMSFVSNRTWNRWSFSSENLLHTDCPHITQVFTVTFLYRDFIASSTQMEFRAAETCGVGSLSLLHWQ